MVSAWSHLFCKKDIQDNSLPEFPAYFFGKTSVAQKKFGAVSPIYPSPRTMRPFSGHVGKHILQTSSLMVLNITRALSKRRGSGPRRRRRRRLCPEVSAGGLSGAGAHLGSHELGAPGMVWFGLVWVGLGWVGLGWFGLLVGLVQFRFGFGLCSVVGWFGFAWSGLLWFGWLIGCSLRQLFFFG